MKKKATTSRTFSILRAEPIINNNICNILPCLHVFMRVRVAKKKALGKMISSASRGEMEMKIFFTVDITTKRYMIYGKDQRGWYNLPTNTLSILLISILKMGVIWMWLSKCSFFVTFTKAWKTVLLTKIAFIILLHMRTTPILLLIPRKYAFSYYFSIAISPCRFLSFLRRCCY